jgi:urocanate hydratase
VADVVTDQTSAHDPLGGYVPAGLLLEDAAELRVRDPEEYQRRAYRSMASHVAAMVGFLERGAVVFDYGNNLRAGAELGGFDRAYSYPGFVPAFVRPLFCEGKGPFRWVALSGGAEDIVATDRAVVELFPGDERLRRWLRMAEDRVSYQGLPARICWLGLGERDRVALALNDLVRSGECGPLALGRVHMDPASVASPTRETEGMLDGSDAIADWPVLSALLNAAQGASWVAIGNGGGVGVGRSIHSGMVVVADGSELAERKLRRVFWTDPALGVVRYADAAYPEALAEAERHGLDQA